MKVENVNIGKMKDVKVINDDGYEFLFSPLGAALVYIRKDKLYFTRTAFFEKDFRLRRCFYGKTIGRSANRIRGNQVQIGDKIAYLDANEGDNVLHGGNDGLSNKYFNLRTVYNNDNIQIVFYFLSKDGESGYPGNLNVIITYTIQQKGIHLDVKYEAESDEDTLCNFTNHTYFTLGEKNIDNLFLQIDADRYLDVDKDMIASEIKPVTAVMDFRSIKRIGKDIDDEKINHDRLKGYDYFYYFNNQDINRCNVLLRNSEYQLLIYTDFEGVQIYTSNFPEPYPLLPEVKDNFRDSIAIEPSDNHLDLHILKKGEKYIRHISYIIEKVDMNMDKNAVKKEFRKLYATEADHVFSCGGRFEILGNHTDHNHGLCLAATCDLNITAAVKKGSKKGNIVYFQSNGYPTDVVNLDNLYPLDEEKGSSKALIRGIAEYLHTQGYNIGGFTAYSESSIFPGAGVSSSAAFELLVGQIYNDLYNGGQIPRLLLCKAGQYAENRYFGKASGLLDQIGVGFGNISYIDFKNISEPKIQQIPFNFSDLHFVIINTGGSHAKLSDLYSAIPQDMYNAAKKSGVNYLRDTNFEDLDKGELTDMEYSRAMHFYGENNRVKMAVEAIKNNDQETFLKMINESRESSTKYLKNMMVGNSYNGSPLQACDYFMKITDGKGAIKINGGGFAGSVIAVVPTDLLDKVMQKMSDRYGPKNVKEVFVREIGPSIID